MDHGPSTIDYPTSDGRPTSQTNGMNANRLAVNILFFINGFLYGNWVSRIPYIQDIYGLDNSTLGLILLCMSIGAVVSMPIAGLLIFRLGSHQVAMVCAILFLLIIPFIPIASNLIVLGITYFLMGSFTGMKDVAMNAQAVLVEQQLKKPIMSSFHAIWSAGMMLGAGAGAIYTRYHVDLFPHLLSVVIPCGVLLLWAIKHLIVDEVSPSAPGEGGFQWPNRSLVGLSLVVFCSMLGEGAMADWSTNYLEKEVEASPSLAPIGLAAFSMAMMFGRFIGDWLRANLGDYKLLITSSLIALIGMGISLSILSPYTTIGGFFLVGIGLATIVPIAFSRAGSLPGIKPGVGISMVTTIGYAGFLFGPPIIGFLADWQSLRSALTFIALLFLIMTILSVSLSMSMTRKSKLETS